MVLKTYCHLFWKKKKKKKKKEPKFQKCKDKVAKILDFENG